MNPDRIYFPAEPPRDTCWRTADGHVLRWKDGGWTWGTGAVSVLWDLFIRHHHSVKFPLTRIETPSPRFAFGQLAVSDATGETTITFQVLPRFNAVQVYDSDGDRTAVIPESEAVRLRDFLNDHSNTEES